MAEPLRGSQAIFGLSTPVGKAHPVGDPLPLLVSDCLGCQYVSKVLNGAETRYPNVENVAFALVTMVIWLRLYFLPHTICVKTNHPLNQAWTSQKLWEG